MHMSYGVLASKGGVSLLVESTRGTGGVQSDAAIDRFQTVWGATWVAGRLTLTKLHLTYMPNRVGKGAAMLKIDLRDVTGVELSGGRSRSADRRARGGGQGRPTRLSSASAPLRRPRYRTRYRGLRASALDPGASLVCP